LCRISRILKKTNNADHLLLLIVTALSRDKLQRSHSVKSEWEESYANLQCKGIKKELRCLTKIEGKWYYKNQPLQWLFVEISPQIGTMAERLGFLNGKREGQWQEDGLRKMGYYRVEGDLSSK